MKQVFAGLALALFCLCAALPASAAQVTNNDVVSFLFSKGFEQIDIGEGGEIQVQIPAQSGVFTVYVMLETLNSGEVWAIKTLHYVPLVIPEDRYVPMLKFSSAFDYLRALGVSSYVVFRGDDSDLVVESYFPVQYMDNSEDLLENFYQNSFRMIAWNLSVLYEGGKCVLLNADVDSRRQCLHRVDERIGEFYR